MENPITILKDNISELTKAQKNIADYILKNPSEVAFLTINQLATRVNTSTTTIMRLTSSIGYSGYSEFQKGLQQLLREQTAPQNRLTVNLQNVDQDDLWSHTIQHHLFHIQQTMERISKEQLHDVVQRITSSERIYCTNVRSGLPVGEYLTHGLNRSLGNCRLIWADVSDWVDEVVAMNANDVLIAISFPRYGVRIIDFIKAAKARGVQVIAITDSYSSPIVEYANCLLTCDSSSLAFHNSPIPAMVLADYLINAVAITKSEKTKERLNEINEVLTTINYHVQNARQE